MLLASLKFHVRRDKRAEFVCTAENFLSALRQAHGCLECHLMADCEEPGFYLLASQWDRRESLSRFLDSNVFRALLGTRILLRDPPHVSIDEIVRRTHLVGRGRSGLVWRSATADKHP